MKNVSIAVAALVTGFFVVLATGSSARAGSASDAAGVTDHEHDAGHVAYADGHDGGHRASADGHDGGHRASADGHDAGH